MTPYRGSRWSDGCATINLICWRFKIEPQARPPSLSCFPGFPWVGWPCKACHLISINDQNSTANQCYFHSSGLDRTADMIQAHCFLPLTCLYKRKYPSRSDGSGSGTRHQERGQRDSICTLELGSWRSGGLCCPMDGKLFNWRVGKKWRSEKKEKAVEII
ncbi:hypothetical protein BGW36DRAFT_83895 [Talaromyces proteolyticus]|uniref:Uncharacterized protein n=1 Tax=Talaromyces proteolyticus TaxID=1131652 RepID=A0AAD4PZN8_9EURO|nr:uncharacterized protein BGW36DRAFT_83895 [Talaromyces proteolyticus]KAH8703203.1 hypothetical protein BGW36DRAFT_83895 [Talaromyces proteolyticus]